MSRGLWLTPDIIAAIKSQIPHQTRKEIAEAYHIHPTVVSYIALGKRRTPGLSCACGWCEKCRNRDAAERYRERRKKRLNNPAST